MAASIMMLPRCFGGPNQVVTLVWRHDPGPYSYKVYESTNGFPFAQWYLRTNVVDLTVQIAIQDGPHFYAVTCVDTNTGDESSFATK